MAEVTIDLESMTATVKPVVVDKYARKLVQDDLKSFGIYGSTVWVYPEIDGVMQFKITNPYMEMAKIINDSSIPTHNWLGHE